METMNIYMFTELGQIKATVVAANEEIAVLKLQEWLDEQNTAKDYFQVDELVESFTGIGDWELLIHENYKVGGEQQTLTKNAVSFRYEVFELPFSFNKVYGGI